MAYLRALTAAGGFAVWLSVPTAAQDKLSANTLVERGTDYLVAYAPRVSGVILEEQYMLIEIAGRMTTPQRIASDVVLINLNGRIMALRDVYAVDTKPLRERTPRINTLLADPSVQAWNLAQQYAQHSHHYFRAEIVAHLSEPMLALNFLAPINQPGLTYRLDGQKKMNGVAVAGLRFQEPTARDKQYLLGTQGNAHGSGRFWMEPATGAIHQTELWMEAPFESARIQVNYAPDPALGVLVPKEVTATFEAREPGTGTGSASTGTHQARQRFECTVRYSNVRHMPIDLTKVVR